MSKKLVYALVLVGLVLSLAACGGNGVTCPTGYALQNATANNPQGFCKNSDGRIAPVVTPASGKGMDLGQDWKDSKNPLQKLECGLNTTADICK